MDTEQIREAILRELPAILEQDAEVQQLVLRLSREHFAGKAETESRFDRLLEELRRDREAQKRKWQEQDRKWHENQATINQVHLIIQNGMVIACKINSSISKPEVYAFQRKVEFYERLHQRPITRRRIISPMVQPQAKETAQKLGIEVYGYARDVAL